MATRSRRSAAGSDSLNPAMIQLYDTGRLRRELKQRGLDTTGTRNILADRLQEAVLSERNSRQTYSPPPQTEKPTKRGTKRSLKGDEENENETSLDSESIISPQPKKSRHSEELDEINLIEESFSIELSNISSIDEVQMEAEKAFVPHCLPGTTTVHREPFPMLEGERSLISNEEANPRTETKMEVVPSEVRNPEIKIRIRSPKKPRASPDERKQQESNRERKVNEKVVVEQEQSSSSDDEELKWLYKTRREKKARKTLFEDDLNNLNKNDNESDEVTEASAVKSIFEESQMSEREIEGSGRERSSKSSSMESSKIDSVINIKDKPAKTLMQKGSIKIKFKTNLLKTTLERTSEPKRKETPPGLAGMVTKDGKMHVDGMLAATSQEKRRSFTPPLSSPNAEKTKDQNSRKKIPLRMQAPVDVLDSIFDKQAQLLSSKYKTEQERALERQKLEMEKRRQNAIPSIASSSTASSSGLEKRRHVDFVIPSKLSQEQRVAQHHSSLPAPPDLRSHIPPSSRHIRENTNVDEKRLLAQLPPPPPPPPLLPYFAKVSMPSTSTFSFDNTSSVDHPRVESIEETVVGHYVPFMTPTTPCSSDSPLSVRTPPSVPHYSSPSEASVEHLHSIEASTSVTKIDSERIKEMASALQAVFARLGNVPPPPAAPKLDTAENALKETTVVMISDPITIDKKSASSIIEKHEITNKSTQIKSGPGYGNVVSEISSDCVVGHESTHSARIMQGIASTSDSSPRKSDTSTPLQSVSNLGDTGHFTEKEVISHLPEGIENDYESEVVVSIVEEVVCATVMSELSISSNHSEDKNKKSDEVGEKEELERKPDISEDLLRDPRRLLQKASDVLKNLQSLEIAAEQAYAEKQNQQQYEQLPLDEKYEDADNEDKPLPDFHGEPVPDSDDEIIIEGVTRKRPTKKSAIQEEEPVPGDEQIEVDFYNADLNVKASETSQEIIDPDNGDGFALMWGGARSTYGVRIPSDVANFPAVVFQIKLLECLPIKHLPFEEIDAHDIRVGWSAQNSTNILGEAPHSYAYDLLAKKATNNFFMDYGEPCQVGDIVTSCLDLALGKIYFWKNMEYLGVAFSEVSFNENDIVFPHICTKNYKLSVNYGDSQSDGWILVAELQKDEALNTNALPIYFSKLDRTVLVRGPVPPSSKSECTVLMMVGLPGVGKTTWVRQYLREHPQEQWTLLSTDTILAAMKVNGVSRSRVHQGRWDMIMGLIAKALNRSLHLACRRRRNYIIDQTNVSKEARRRKLSQFKDFQRKCVVIIPSEEEMIARQMKQSRMDGAGPIPVEAMLELKAMLSIPNVETEPIEDVFFVEPPLERIGDAIDLVLRFNEEARPWCQKRRSRRGESLRQNDSRLMNNARLSNDITSAITNINAHDGNQLNGQPSPTDTRQNEGYCGFERELPSSLTSSVASSWAERKNTSIS